MHEKACLFFAIVLYVAVVSESRVIDPPIKDISFGNEEIPFMMDPLETGKKSRSPLDYDYNEGTPRNDDNEPDVDDDFPETNSERFPSGVEGDEIPQENDGVDKSDDEILNKPFDKEDSDELDNNGKDFGTPLDESKPVHKDDDELETIDFDPEEFEEDEKKREEKPDEEKREEEENNEKPEEEDLEKPSEGKEDEELDEENPDEEKREEENEKKLDEEEKEEGQERPDEGKEEELDEEMPNEEKKEELDEVKPDEERKVEEEEKHELESVDEEKHVTENELIDVDNEKEKIPKEIDEETDENDNKNKDGIPQKEGAGFFSGGSIFDTPFFNLEKVSNYFSKLDRALGHVFKQKIDDALLQNGTYTNTTEEEVDIDGEKYIITKSVIKGADNHSSMYVEALSAKPKKIDTKEMKDIEIKNLTQT